MTQNIVKYKSDEGIEIYVNNQTSETFTSICGSCSQFVDIHLKLSELALQISDFSQRDASLHSFLL